MCIRDSDTIATNSNELINVTATDHHYHYQQLDVTITPNMTTSLMTINVNIGKIGPLNYTAMTFKIVRNVDGTQTDVNLGNPLGNRLQSTFAYRKPDDGNHSDGVSFTVYDTPSTTNQVIYELHISLEYSGNQSQNGIFINRSKNHDNNGVNYNAVTSSNMMVIEYSQ